MFNALLIFGLLLSACGPSEADLTPTVDPNAIRTEAVSTFASSLTLTALAAPTRTSTLIPSPTVTLQLVTTLTTSTSQAGVGASCYNLTYARDVTIPDNTQMTAGQSFTKTWQVSNSGSCAWAPGFKFSLVGGDAMNGQTLTLSQPVGAGATTELSVAMTVPAGKTGTIQGAWRMSDDKGAFFGDQLTVVIVVGGGSAPTNTPGTPAAPASTATPTLTPTTGP
jgi:hypothetical protein